MAYSTKEDITRMLPAEVLVQLTDDEALGEVNDARVSEAVTQADAEIDSFCGARYAVPFAAAPEAIKKLSVDIAIYNLYSRTVQSMPEVRAERYRNAVRQLEGIARGTVSIGAAALPPERDDSGSETNKAADANIFTRDGMEGF